MLILFNKPYGVLCQFTSPDGRRTPGHGFRRPAAADRRWCTRPSHHDPRHHQVKTYLAEVEGVAGDDALAALRRSVQLKDGPTRPAEVRALEAAPDWLWPRAPPVRFRKSIPTAWLELSISEGRNHQVRHMTAAVELPTLRLIRTRIGEHELGALNPGEFRSSRVV